VDVAQKVIPKKKVKEEGCVWKEMPNLQVLNHLSTVRAISLPLLYSLACLLLVLMIRWVGRKPFVLM
jgi:hypothetical protein